jgi:hypothetical protein
VGHASCNPIHFQRIPVYCENQWAVSFKHKHKIHKQNIMKYISNKDAASTVEMLEDAEKF